MNQQKRKDSTNSAERAGRSVFQNIGEKDSGRSLFQLALEVQDLLEKQKLKRNLGDVGIRTHYIEQALSCLRL
jgi:hypothetical protein